MIERSASQFWDMGSDWEAESGARADQVEERVLMKRPRRNAAAIEPASSFVPGPQLRALAHVQLAARKPVKIAAISIARSRPLSRRAMMFRTSDGVGMFTPISRRRFVRASSRLFLWERRLRTTFCVTSPRSSSESDTRILRTMAGERSCRNLSSNSRTKRTESAARLGATITGVMWRSRCYRAIGVCDSDCRHFDAGAASERRGV